MRAVIAAVAIMALAAEAFTDFHAMNPNHKRTELADGRVHISHDVHHTFDEEGTFFKAKYEAIHDKKWHFVELHNHGVDFLKHVECGAGDHELHVNHPSEALKTELAKQKYEWTVLTAHHVYHCGETAIFRFVTGATYDSEKDRLTIHTVQAGYQDVFEYLDYDQDTNHLKTYVDEEPAEDLSLNSGYELPQPEGEVTTQDEDAPKVASGRSMKTQWKLWKKIKKVAKKVVKVVKKVVKKAVQVVTAPVRIVKALVTGTWDYNKSWKILNLKWNGAVNRKFKKWQFTGDFKFAASAAASAGLRFRFYVKSYKLQLIEAYYYGSFSGGVRASLNARVTYDLSKSKQVANIRVATITFSIGPVPVVIQIDAPITVGFDLDIDGKLTLNALLYVSGSIKQGIRYTRAKGFHTINEKRFSKQRDFNPRIFRYEVVLVPWIQVMFVANINFIGGAQIGIRLSGEAILKSSTKCILLLQMNLQPVLLAGAQIDVKILGRSLYKKTWGPKSLVSWKIPLFNYCIPRGRFFRQNNRGMLLQTATSTEDGTSPENPNAIEYTKEETLGANETGTNWFGESSCMRPQGQTDLKFSLQFLAEENYTQVVVTIMQNITTDNSRVIDADGVSNFTYDMTNTQQTYRVASIVGKGDTVTMQHYSEPDPDDQYTANSTETILPNISTSFTLIVGAYDIQDLTVESESMFCGRVQLTTESFNDDNKTFTIFASGESTQETLDDLITKMNIAIIVIPIIAVVCMLAVLVAFFMVRRKNQLAQGASWAKMEQDSSLQKDDAERGAVL